MPNPGERPGPRRAVVPEVVARVAGVGELVVDRLPGGAAVVGALHLLAEPAPRLRCPESVRVGWRGGHMVDLPAGEQRSFDLPVPAGAVRGQDEGALAGTDENTNGGHGALLGVGGRGAT